MWRMRNIEDTKRKRIKFTLRKFDSNFILFRNVRNCIILSYRRFLYKTDFEKISYICIGNKLNYASRSYNSIYNHMFPCYITQEIRKRFQIYEFLSTEIRQQYTIEEKRKLKKKGFDKMMKELKMKKLKIMFDRIQDIEEMKR